MGRGKFQLHRLMRMLREEGVTGRVKSPHEISKTTNAAESVARRDSDRRSHRAPRSDSGLEIYEGKGKSKVILPQHRSHLNTNPQITKRAARLAAAPSPECFECGYATYPNTGRCTNFECPKHRREGGAMTASQLLHEYAEPRLYHGRRWGAWSLDGERMCLVFAGQPVEHGDGSGVTQGVPLYVAIVGKYEVDLERISDSASMLDWISQIAKKTWATARVTRDLLNALEDVFHLQKNLCGGAMGGGKGGRIIGNPPEFLRRRFATVGVDGVA
jgi:hypothetical protein